MTDEELAAIADRFEPSSEVHALVAEVRRLRGLIARAERASDCEVGSEPNGGCPWRGNAGPHVGCPAFTPDGAVR